MRYLVKMSKVANGAALRTNEVEGITNELPQVGKRFGLVGKSLTPGGIARLVETSPVVELDQDTILTKTEAGSSRSDQFTIKTENSVYSVFVLETLED